MNAQIPAHIDSIHALNSCDDDTRLQFFLGCCTSKRWANALAKTAPFTDVETLLHTSDSIWHECNEQDFLEAFAGHPEIGDMQVLRDKYSTQAHAEQGQVRSASATVLLALQEYNKQYRKKFGFIFIVCASGKSAEDMLGLLKNRLPNSVQQELQNAAHEQNKITHLRLRKSLTE